MANIFPTLDFEKQERYDLKVGKLQISGLVRTHDWFIERYFKNIKDSQSLRELNNSIIQSLVNVDRLNLIHSVDVGLDLDDNNETIVHLTLIEKAPISGKFGISATTNNDVEVYVNGSYSSLVGVADTLSLSASYFGNKCFSISSKLEFQELLIPSFHISSNIFSKRKIQDTKLEKTFSGFGFGANVYKSQNIGYTFQKREVLGIEKEIDLTGDVLQKNTLSQFFHSFRKVIYANKSSGLVYRCQNTLNEGSLFGTLWFFKSEQWLTFYKTLFSCVLAAIDVSFGSISSKSKFIDLPDRIPVKIRGFPISPRRGKFGWSVLASLGIPVSTVIRSVSKSVNLNLMGGVEPHFHSFFNFGSNFTRWSRSGSCLAVSYGIGIYFTLGPGRVEFNYCLPLSDFNTESFNKFDVHFQIC